MTPFQEELYRLIHECKKETNVFTTTEEDSGNEINKIIKFSQKWDFKDKSDKLTRELGSLNEKISRELKIANEKIGRGFFTELTPIIDELFVVSRLTDPNTPADRGLKIALSNLEKMLSRRDGGLIRPQIGDEVDPSRHKAIAAEEVLGHLGNTVSEVCRYGYFVLGQVIREAEVKVKCGVAKK